MTNLKKTLVAASIAAIAGPAGAVVFGDGLNDIEIINRENQYRLTTACTPGACVDGTTIGGGTYTLVNPANTDAPLVGDLFIGVFASRNITKVGGAAQWGEDNIAAGGIDTFTGYFVQEVKQVAINVDGTNDRIILGTPTTDPFGILAAGETARLYVDNAALANTPYAIDAGTVASVIASMTDGALWASLTVGGTVLGVAVDNDGYLYSLINTGAPGTNTVGDFFAAYNIGVTGPAYNVNIGPTINDPAESLKGGGQIGDPILTALQNALGICVPVAGAYACNEIVGNGQLGTNQTNPFPSGPWLFASEDPFQLFQPVPEPGTLALLGLGLASLAGLRRRKAA